MKIALLGDIGLFGKYTIDNPVIKDYFGEASSLLSTMDYVIGNLEVPVCTTEAEKKGKSAHIKSNPENIELLKFLNVTHVSLANNHIYDYGEKGYTETKNNLKNNGIKYFGVENLSEFIEGQGNKIALSGYVCYSTNALGYLENENIGVNELDFDKVEKNLHNKDSEGYFNIVSFHIGEEHIHYPNINHIKLARKLSDTSSYIFYGHHPHVLQGIEKYKESLHLYSLGNFCFDDVYTEKSNKPLVTQKQINKESAIVILDIQENKLLDYKVIPIYDDGKKITIPTDGLIDRKINEYSSYLEMEEELYLNTRQEILDKYVLSRKKLRNLKWFYKRLNLDTFLMLKNAKKNSIKLNKVLQSKVNN